MLRNFKISYKEFTPYEPLPPNIKVVITTRKEKKEIPLEEVLCIEDFYNKEIELKGRLLTYQLGKRGKLLIGIDPGLRIGITSYYNNVEVYSGILNSLEELMFKVKEILDTFKGSKLIRIGNGNLNLALDIAKSIKERFEKVNIEIVDEKGTTLLAKNGKRSKLDEYSAKIIAFREGKRFN
ncbi:hypothetical protein HRbin06_00419 [archaeon HR06]|nr:hypothetical protein HRbin06_00419 [archaeon HR06]